MKVRVAVVGHVEWIRFARVDRVPQPGGIAHATDAWEGAGGGGGVAAVQLARLAGECHLFTALGDDGVAQQTRDDLERHGVRVHAATRARPTRSALTMVDDQHERTIVTLGTRLAPHGDDALPWDLLRDAEGVFVTAGDTAAILHARRARVMVATSRILQLLGSAEVALDAVVGSARDPAERYDPEVLPHEPGLVVRTDGASGGSWATVDGRGGRYQAVPPPGPLVDTYGAGDSFQAGLTFGLAAGMGPEQALSLAARCGAYAAAGRGPTGGQLARAALEDQMAKGTD